MLSLKRRSNFRESRTILCGRQLVEEVKWQVERRKDYHNNRLGLLNSDGDSVFPIPLFFVGQASHTGTDQESLRTCKALILAATLDLCLAAGVSTYRWAALAWSFPSTSEVRAWGRGGQENYKSSGGTRPSIWSEWLRLDPSINGFPA